MTLQGVIGNVGRGKTLFTTWFGLKVADTGKKVFSNYRIFDKRIELLDVNKFLNINERLESLTILDEIYAWGFDSRTSQTKMNVAISKIIMQSRKRGIDILWTAQLPSSVDLRLRRLTDTFIIALKPHPEYFRYAMITNEKIRRFKLPIIEAQKIFKMYDTKEIVSLPQ